MPNTINLAEMAGGALAERFNIEMQKVLDNIMDPNTDCKKTRKLTLTLTFKADENRDVANLSIEAKTALAPAQGLSTKIVMDRDRAGNAVGAELFQTGLFTASDYAGQNDKVSPIGQKAVGRE